jgi:hypothetical protein
MAVASIFAASQSQAASVTVTTTERGVSGRHVQYHPRPHHRDCMVKKVKTYRHGKVIIKETRVCR